MTYSSESHQSLISRKKQFRRADKTACMCDMRPFALDGWMDLDITFEGCTMKTPGYIKMDLPTQLLLSEGVCRQLRILSYHLSIVAEEPQDNLLLSPESKMDLVEPEGSECPYG